MRSRIGKSGLPHVYARNARSGFVNKGYAQAGIAAQCGMAHCSRQGVVPH